MEASKKHSGLKGVLGVGMNHGEGVEPEYLVMNKSTKWTLLFLSALQQFVRKATTLKPEDFLVGETPRMKMLGLLTESPLKVRIAQVASGARSENQAALSITTEYYPTRELWLTYDEIRQPDSEKWDKFLVLMYAENDYDWNEPVPQEGIVMRYPVVSRELRTVEWMMDIACDVVTKLYKAGPFTPLQE